MYVPSGVLDETKHDHILPYRWSAYSRERMAGLHHDLVRVLDLAIGISQIDLIVLEGRRTLDRQMRLVRNGASRTLRSRHLTGHAVDIAPLDEDGHPSWAWPLYHRIAPVIKRAARDLEVPIEWGGDWERFQDGPHWQLPWDNYPI
jgi:peptidoglycan L-alanyl-D-glutamate endopeptidase CwlK